jgi:zinc transporter
MPGAAAKPERSQRLHNWFGLVFAYRLDAAGGGAAVGWPEVTAACRADATPEDTEHRPLWVHLDLRHPHARHWLEQESGLDELTVDALTATNAGPRLVRRGDSLLLVLKGIDHSSTARTGDMLAARLWTDGRLLISAQHGRVGAFEEMHRELRHGRGPAAIDALIADLADRLMTHADDVLEDLLEAARRINQAGNRPRRTEDMVSELATLRRGMIRMRFHLLPQRQALVRLATGRTSWFGDAPRRAVREVADRCQHAIDGLGAAGDITEITQDEILQRSSETTEHRLFSLTVITAIFLPLTFITGLLGVNLAGIPDAGDPLAFLILCLLLVGIVLGQLWLLRRKGWL